VQQFLVGGFGGVFCHWVGYLNSGYLTRDPGRFESAFISFMMTFHAC